MAVANLTPDSFSGDGLMAPGDSTNDFLDRVEQRARDAVRDGADLLDLGAESTRPGHTEISAADEIARLAPAIERLRRALPTLALSADTQKVEVAAAALDAGAHMLNDIWGTRSSDEMLQLAAKRGVPIVVMHNRKEVATGEQAANFAEKFLALPRTWSPCAFSVPCVIWDTQCCSAPAVSPRSVASSTGLQPTV